MILDIFSDTICPWCFIGKRRLERALAQHTPDGLEVTWRPFQLNPDMSPGGVDRQAYLEAKFGGAAGAHNAYEPVRAAGQSEGIPFAFDHIGRTPNTFESHRLIRFAMREDKQDDMVEALFNAYFIEGRDIGEIDTLAAVAEEIGIDPDLALEYLRGDEDREQIAAEDELGRRMQITGVPTFIFNRQVVAAGAREPEVFLEAFEVAAQHPVEEENRQLN